jgi:GTPase SAR1 family protein
MRKVYKLLQHDGIPVVLVLNKCDAEEDFVQGVQHSIREHCQWASGIVQVASDPRVGPPRFRCHLCLSDEILINVRKRSYMCGCSEGVALPFKAHYGVARLPRSTKWVGLKTAGLGVSLKTLPFAHGFVLCAKIGITPKSIQIRIYIMGKL